MTNQYSYTHHNAHGLSGRTKTTSLGKVLFPVMLIALLCAGTAAQAEKIGKFKGRLPGGAYTFDGKKLIYSEENASGYRSLTAMEPAGGGEPLLSRTTFYPASEAPGAFDVSFSSREGPEINGHEATVMVHTHIPLAP